MMKYLQKLGKALMLPVAVLPICGILMGLGYALAPGAMGVLNCTPFVRQYGILSNGWGVFLCQKEYQTNDIRRNSKNW